MKERLRNRVEDFSRQLDEELEANPRYRETLSFLGKMFLAGLLFRLILFLNPETEFLQVWLAGVSQFFLNLLGYGFEQQGFLLLGDETNYLITRDCLGWKSMAAFVGLVFASAEDLRKEFRILLGGIIALTTANIIRIVSTVMLSEAGLISFDVVHTFLWRWGMTIVVLSIWYMWLTDRLSPELQGIFK